MSSEKLLGGVALVLATLSLGLSVFRARSEGVAPACSCEAAVASAMRTAAAPPGGATLSNALPIALSQLDARVRKLEDGLPVAGASGKPVAPAPADSAESGSFPRYASFVTSNAAVKIAQDASGNLSVHNSDPALAYKVMLVEARRPDGSVDHVTVVVPPPEK